MDVESGEPGLGSACERAERSGECAVCVCVVHLNTCCVVCQWRAGLQDSRAGDTGHKLI